MSKQNRMIWLVLVILMAAILPPVIFGPARQIEGQTGGDAWRNFIFDFQTLITGVFAVFAAYITVHQMKLSDDKAEKRHIEISKLTIRQDRLIIERAVNPHFLELKEIAKRFWDVDLEKYKVYDLDLDTVFNAVREVFDTDYTDALSELRELLRRPQLLRAQELFNGELLEEFNDLSETVDRLHPIMRFMVTNMKTYSSSNVNHWRDEQFSPNKELIVGDVYGIPFQLQNMLDQLQSLATLYDIDCTGRGKYQII